MVIRLIIFLFVHQLTMFACKLNKSMEHTFSQQKKVMIFNAAKILPKRERHVRRMQELFAFIAYISYSMHRSN